MWSKVWKKINMQKRIRMEININHLHTIFFTQINWNIFKVYFIIVKSSSERSYYLKYRKIRGTARFKETRNLKILAVDAKWRYCSYEYVSVSCLRNGAYAKCADRLIYPLRFLFFFLRTFLLKICIYRHIDAVIIAKIRSNVYILYVNRVIFITSGYLIRGIQKYNG